MVKFVLTKLFSGKAKVVIWRQNCRNPGTDLYDKRRLEQLKPADSPAARCFKTPAGPSQGQTSSVALQQRRVGPAIETGKHVVRLQANIGGPYRESATPEIATGPVLSGRFAAAERDQPESRIVVPGTGSGQHQSGEFRAAAAATATVAASSGVDVRWDG